VTDQNAKLYLVDYGDGGWGANAKTRARILGTVTLVSTQNDGWQRLRLEVHGDTVVGSFGGSFGCPSGVTFAGVLDGKSHGQGVFVGYREFMTDNSKTRPVTIDQLIIRRGSSALNLFGQPVATSKGTPRINGNGPPTIGHAGWGVVGSGLVPSQLAFLVWGFSKANPRIDLGTIGGQPGSILEVTPTFISTILVDSQGLGVFPLALPCQSSLLGGRLYWQILDFDVSLPFLLPFGNSAGLEIILGS
jgi:hypothetical protein